jgi:hypothetical protein
MPRFGAAGLDARLQPNSDRFRCMATARAEYARIVIHQVVQMLLRTRVPPAADRKLHIGQHVLVWREKERKYCEPFAILNLSEDATQVTMNVDRGHMRGVFSADCVRPAPEMADVVLATISSTLSSYSTKAPVMHRAVYTQNQADVPVFVSEAVANKDLVPLGLNFLQLSRRSYWAFLSAGLSKLCFVRRSPRMLRSCKVASFYLSKIATVTTRYTKRVMLYKVFLIHSSSVLYIIHLTRIRLDWCWLLQAYAVLKCRP